MAHSFQEIPGSLWSKGVTACCSESWPNVLSWFYLQTILYTLVSHPQPWTNRRWAVFVVPLRAGGHLWPPSVTRWKPSAGLHNWLKENKNCAKGPPTRAESRVFRQSLPPQRLDVRSPSCGALVEGWNDEQTRQSTCRWTRPSDSVILRESLHISCLRAAIMNYSYLPIVPVMPVAVRTRQESRRISDLDIRRGGFFCARRWAGASECPRKTPVSTSSRWTF